MRFIDVGHSLLAYWRFGTGPDLVFVHGWPLHSATFRGVISRLADAFTCHVVDLPAAGQSVSQPDAPIDFAAHAVALRRAIDDLGLRRYALVGHDSGGLVARLVAASDLRAVGLVLSGTEISGHHSWLVRLLAIVARLPLGSQLVRWTMKIRALRRSPLGFRACFRDLDFIDGEFRDLFVAPIAASSALAARQLQHLRTIDWSLIDRLPETHARIAAKTLLIWGTEDGLFPIDRARRMLPEFSAGAEWCEIPRGRAFVHEEQPQAFAEHARPFLLKTLGAVNA
jgi:pimeloyl-ACP methyl ester carboxylesterase